MVPDKFLPVAAFEAAGGARRRKSSVSIREIVGVEQPTLVTTRIPQQTSRVRQSEEAWKKLAKKIYVAKSKEFDENEISVNKAFSENVELLRSLLARCPVFAMILAHILLNKIGFRSQEVDWASEMVDWGEEESRQVGHSFANFLRMRKTGEVAVDGTSPIKRLAKRGAKRRRKRGANDGHEERDDDI